MSNIPIFIPHVGCKNDCAFCNQKSITGKVVAPSFEETEKIIEENLSTLEGNDNKIAFFGGSFTGIGEDLMEGYLRVAHKYVAKGLISGIRLSTRPDYIDEKILDTLEKYSVTNIELGAQSLDDEVLCAARRGHSAEDVEKAARMIKKRNIKLGLQMMIGLPSDTYEKSLNTAKRFVELGADEVRIYPTVIIKDTHLEKMYNDKEYIPMSFDEAIDTAADCYSIFFENNVKILRIGLQNSEGLKESVVGGFYHDALGEIVYSRVIRHKVAAVGCAHIEYNKRFLSKVLGQKKENLAYFEKAGITYTLTENNSLSGVCIDGKYVLTI
ncbi:MAG: radical SAM protein [Clostridia bacterium]|nr:radical SAM protein [Clostridia bacterium]